MWSRIGQNWAAGIDVFSVIDAGDMPTSKRAVCIGVRIFDRELQAPT
jgi:hypothetical protein